MTGPAAAAGTWTLGDRQVNRLGFGAMRLTGTRPFSYGEPRDRAASIAVLRRAVELGVNHVDTASFYFSQLRSANELINAALAPYADDLVIVTKVGPDRDKQGEWSESWAGPDQLRGQVEENLRQLGRDHLDVVNLRAPGPVPLTEHLEALVELREAGLLRHVGVSNVTADQLAEARGITEIVCVQNPHGVGTGRADSDAVVSSCAEHGIAFVPFFAIAGNARETGTTSEPAEVLAIAEERGLTPAQVRLAWTLGLGPHVLAIPGTGSLAHLEENVAAAAVHLDADEMRRLSAT